ncbi:16S rRNA (guanine966-N2)-methyltransferase [Spiroplasma helicoides]|uniref:16S rRNA (Guanine966-N2)-methyltransferase n=1 Tax=Spiroplasma helicoides TaxID=216938 RepID=A0A1B3SLD6_9MOLU|nr:16S rRNA (guanine(966)-N(2))-methyltransferase RsmD [Spiroplasma helicoides]AOG60732.1 16S rRNA (guanine966-N2)-methyltransferase [Spiroplasma helicoides]
MRVISGKFRGRVLKTLEGKNTRPTTARVKEDMFNILNNYFIYNEKTSLDLFGGSGALSIEGLSRGIKFAYINDSHKPALEIINQNLKNIDQNSYKLLNYDYMSTLKYINSQNVKIDLLYIDPPFAQVEYYYEIFDYLKANKILNNYGILIIEAENLLDLDKYDFLTLLKQKDYKNKHLYLFRIEEEE